MGRAPNKSKKYYFLLSESALIGWHLSQQECISPMWTARTPLTKLDCTEKLETSEIVSTVYIVQCKLDCTEKLETSEIDAHLSCHIKIITPHFSWLWMIMPMIMKVTFAMMIVMMMTMTMMIIIMTMPVMMIMIMTAWGVVANSGPHGLDLVGLNKGINLSRPSNVTTTIQKKTFLCLLTMYHTFFGFAIKL